MCGGGAYCVGVEGLNQLDAQAGDLSGNQIMLTDFFSPSYLPRAMIAQKSVSGMCLECVWNVSGMCLECVWRVSE